MNYILLKNIIDNVVQNFICPSCQTPVSEQDLEIVWAAGNTVNVNVKCSACQRNAMIKTEVAHVDIHNIWHMNLPDALKNALQNQKNMENVRKSQVTDEDIIDLNKRLKDMTDLWDLFGK